MKSQLTMVGNREFWQTAHDLNPAAFQAALDLSTLFEKLTSKPTSELLHTILRRIMTITFNSFRAVTTLALNGYGADAMRIVRGMFEAEVTAEYLRNHPEKLQDYLDFLHISIMSQIRFLEKKNPKLLADKIPADALKSAKEQYAKIEHRFKTRRGYDRGSWCDKSLYEMADDTGRKDAYRTLYHSASGIHHFDVTAQAAQFNKDTFDVDIAPSPEWLESAMSNAHSSVLSVMKDFNEEAALGFDKDIEAAGKVFREVWKARLEPDS